MESGEDITSQFDKDSYHFMELLCRLEDGHESKKKMQEFGTGEPLIIDPDKS